MGLSLGIVGMSEGNGHPYSWSAIFNGYNPKYMKDCPFPVIPEYLNKQKFPEDSIKSASVDYIWTQNKELSRHIAKSSNIGNIVDHLEEMVNKVDAVLLARDDAENHYDMALPFLKKGLPIYIDKPLAYDCTLAKKIFNAQKFPGQIFTCSALRYAKEFRKMRDIDKKLGDIHLVEAFVMKSWKKYSVHIIDPVVFYLFKNSKIEQAMAFNYDKVSKVVLGWDNGITSAFTSLGNMNAPIEIKIYCEEGTINIKFKDTFEAFKGALKDFVDRVMNKKFKDDEVIMKIVSIIEKGVRN